MPRPFGLSVHFSCIAFALHFHCIATRFRATAPSAAPSRRDKIRIRSTHGLTCNLAGAIAVTALL